MANLIEQLRAYGGYLDELSPPPSPIGNARNRSRRRTTFAAIAAALVAAFVAFVVVAASDTPGRLTTNAPVSTQNASTSSVTSATSVIGSPAPESAIVAESPTLDQQIARL